MTATANMPAYKRDYYLRRKSEVAFVSVQLSHEERAEVDAAAKRDGVTRSEKIREYITWGLERNV